MQTIAYWAISRPLVPSTAPCPLQLLVLLSQKVAVSAPVESVFMEIHISLGG
jgi:hypothetical protein